MSFRKFLNDNKITLILRGISGAGKDYKVRQLLVKFGGNEDHVFSADKYFEQLAEKKFFERFNRKPNEKESVEWYKQVWNAGALGAAHRYCFEEFKAAVDLGISPVIVDNTNTTKSQFERYFKYAEDNGYKVRIEEPDSPWWLEARSDLGNTQFKYSEKLQKLKDELTKRNQHGVPPEAIEKIINSVWQNIPGGTGKYVTYDQVFK